MLEHDSINRIFFNIDNLKQIKNIYLSYQNFKIWALNSNFYE